MQRDKGITSHIAGCAYIIFSTCVPELPKLISHLQRLAVPNFLPVTALPFAFQSLEYTTQATFIMTVEKTEEKLEGKHSVSEYLTIHANVDAQRRSSPLTW